jgi:hypothetical protein
MKKLFIKMKLFKSLLNEYLLYNAISIKKNGGILIFENGKIFFNAGW